MLQCALKMPSGFVLAMEDNTIEYIEEPKGKFWHWKRVVHILMTILLITFLIYYYLPENRLIRSVDVCGYYAGKTNRTCQCTPVTVEGRQGITTIFYPNHSVSKPFTNHPRLNLLNGTG